MSAERLGAQYAFALRAHWIYVVITVALALAAATAYVLLAEKRYEARAEVFVAPVPPEELSTVPAMRALTFGRGVQVAARLTQSPQVTSRVRERLGLSLPRSAIADLVFVTPQEQANTVRITGIGGTPEAAATIANAFADALLTERTRRFQQQLGRAIERMSGRLEAIDDATSAEAASLANRLADYRALSGGPDPTLEVVRAAVPPSSAAWPRPAATILVAVVLGLLIGIALAVSLESLNPTVVRADALTEPSGPRLLARMPRPTHEEARELLLAPGKVSDELPEPMRNLSAGIEAILPNGSGPKTFVVTSPGSGEGAPVVAATVAGVIARSGVPVALLDVDFDHAPLRAIVNGNGTPAAPSVGQMLTSGQGRYLHHLHRVDSSSHRLRLLLADPNDRRLSLPPNGVSTLATDLKSHVSVLVISAPPLPAKETAALLGLADAVIVVVALSRTRRDQLANLRQLLALQRIQSYGYVALEE